MLAKQQKEISRKEIPRKIKDSEAWAHWIPARPSGTNHSSSGNNHSGSGRVSQSPARRREMLVPEAPDYSPEL